MKIIVTGINGFVAQHFFISFFKLHKKENFSVLGVGQVGYAF